MLTKTHERRLSAQARPGVHCGRRSLPACFIAWRPGTRGISRPRFGSLPSRSPCADRTVGKQRLPRSLETSHVERSRRASTARDSSSGFGRPSSSMHLRDGYGVESCTPTIRRAVARYLCRSHYLLRALRDGAGGMAPPERGAVGRVHTGGPRDQWSNGTGSHLSSFASVKPTRRRTNKLARPLARVGCELA